MLSASETDRTTVEARRLRAEVEQLLEDNLQLKRHNCDKQKNEAEPDNTIN